MNEAREGPQPLDADTARRIAALSYRARQVVTGLMSGMHRSPSRGASVVFVEHREYRPGDDPRLLDWRAFARTDRHAIKRFEQETQLRATLLLDRSGSMGYGGSASKVGYGATLLAALAYVLARQGDAVGCATFTDSLQDRLPPRSRATHLDSVMRTLSAPAVVGAITDLTASLEEAAERCGRRGVIAIASDLLDLREGVFAPIRRMVSRGNEVRVFHVLHRDELELAAHGPARFTGTEGESPIEADAVEVRAAYQAEMEAFKERARLGCTAAGARYILAPTDAPPEQILALAVGAGRGGWG